MQEGLIGRILFYGNVEIFEQFGRSAQAKKVVTLDVGPFSQGCWVEEGLKDMGMILPSTITDLFRYEYWQPCSQSNFFCREVRVMKAIELYYQFFWHENLI